MVLLFLACVEPDSPSGGHPTGADTGTDSAVDPVGYTTTPAGREPIGPPVVIGAGLAGLAAALDLPGAIVFEAGVSPGGRAAGEGQRRFLFVESGDVDAVVADWPVMTGGDASETTRTFLEDSAAVHARMEALGLSFLSPQADLLTGRVDLFTVEQEGPALAQAFVDGLASGVELRLETPVTGLVVDETGVIGVQTADGVLETNRVILATGGYTGRIDIVERYAPWPAGSWSSGYEEFSGFAWDLAGTLGLGLSHLDAMGAFDGYLGDFEDGRVHPFATGLPLIWVDASGSRFVNEYDLGSIELEASFWAHAPVLTLTTKEEIVAAAYAGYEDQYAATLRCYSTLEALAAAEGADAAGLTATLALVATYRAGATDPLGRPGNSFPALTEAPCAATQGRKTSKSYGGVDVDDEGRALDTEGRVLPGLWVAGEAAGMGAPGMGGAVGFDGSLAAVVWSGERAARSINAEAVSPP